MEGHIGRRRLAGTSGRFLCFAQGKRFGIASAVQDVQSRQGDREASHGEWRSGVADRYEARNDALRSIVRSRSLTKEDAAALMDYIVSTNDSMRAECAKEWSNAK